MVTNFVIGKTIKLEISSDEKTIVLALISLDNKQEMTFPLSPDEAEVVIATLNLYKKIASAGK